MGDGALRIEGSRFGDWLRRIFGVEGFGLEAFVWSVFGGVRGACVWKPGDEGTRVIGGGISVWG